MELNWIELILGVALVFAIFGPRPSLRRERASVRVLEPTTDQHYRYHRHAAGRAPSPMSAHRPRKAGEPEFQFAAAAAAANSGWREAPLPHELPRQGHSSWAKR